MFDARGGACACAMDDGGRLASRSTLLSCLTLGLALALPLKRRRRR